MLLHRITQRRPGQILDLAVDRQRHVLAVARRADGLDVLDDLAAAVLDHPPRPGATGQAFFEGELDAFLALVLDVGEPQDVRHHLTTRVVAAELLLLVNTGQAQVCDLLGDLRRHLALEIGEVAPGGQLGVELLDVHLEQAGELARLRRLELRVGRDCPHRTHRRAHRENVALAVCDATTSGGHFERTRIARLALGLQEIVIHPLQIKRPPAQRQGASHQAEHDQARTPGRQLTLEQGVVIESDGTLFLHDCGSTTSTCPAGGRRMPSFSRASFSTLP